MFLNIVKKQSRAIGLCRMQYPLSLVLLFVLPLVACPLWGQVVQKKMLLPDEYHLWGEVRLEKVSDDENWAAYTMEYTSGNDTLFVQSIKEMTKHAFTEGENGSFISNDVFICRSQDNLHILNLKTSKRQIISNVLQYSANRTGDLVCLINSENSKKVLEIRSIDGGNIIKINDVVSYLMSPDGNNLVYTTCLDNRNAIALINLKKPKQVKWLEQSSEEKFVGLTWQKEGHALAFIKQYDDCKKNILFQYNLLNQELYHVSASDVNFPENWSIVHDTFRKILISDDLQKVFFAVLSTSIIEVQQEPNLEIWNANDKGVYPAEKYYGSIETKSKLGLWEPVKSKVNVITSNELSSVMLTADMKYAVLSNPKEYEPQFELEGPRDYYIQDLKTFEKKIILKKQPYDLEAMNPSPGGKYLAYFKENNWWIYNPAADTHTNITGSTGMKFKGKKQELVPESVYGNPGWTPKDSEIILYDQYDIWAITPDGKKSTRLTRGREEKIQYRIINPLVNYRKMVYDGPVVEVLDLNKKIFLRAKGNDGRMGCFIWDKSSFEKKMVYVDSYLDQFKFSEKRNRIFFREQRFDMPPKLVSSKNSSEQVSFFRSNPQHKKYHWGKSELINFQNSKAQDLKAVLLYPSAYNPKKKYPMIVNIYEGKADELHLYQNPTFENEGGFNATLMTLEGYFVLLPDISLIYQSPGVSAADCVVSATKAVIEKDIVNSAKIGLMGHSFGGYEAAFTITQTPMFAAAIASGAITDLVSLYYSVGRSGSPEMWRFEGEQWNMGGSPHDMPSIYNANSPLPNAVNIQSPVLLWSGKNDLQVDVHQSLEFYLALRRLKKKSIMILYKHEGHILTKRYNQKDITVRMIEWFNYFLKNDHSYSWIDKGMQ